MKVTIEFLVESYFRNDLHFFEKYFTWGNIQPSRDFLDTLYSTTQLFNFKSKYFFQGKVLKIGYIRGSELPTSAELISSFMESKIIGWTQPKKRRNTQLTLSRITVNSTNIENCQDLFKNEQINDQTYMCGYALKETQRINIVIIWLIYYISFQNMS